MTCPICLNEPYPNGPHPNSPATCAFHGADEFNSDNYCCGSIMRLRWLMELSETGKRIDDMSMGFLPCIEEDNEARSSWIVMGWYKDRGRTSWAKVIHYDSGEERPLLFIDVKRTLLRGRFLFKDDATNPEANRELEAWLHWLENSPDSLGAAP